MAGRGVKISKKEKGNKETPIKELGAGGRRSVFTCDMKEGSVPKGGKCLKEKGKCDKGRRGLNI